MCHVLRLVLIANFFFFHLSLFSDFRLENINSKKSWTNSSWTLDNDDILEVMEEGFKSLKGYSFVCFSYEDIVFIILDFDRNPMRLANVQSIRVIYVSCFERKLLECIKCCCLDCAFKMLFVLLNFKSWNFELKNSNKKHLFCCEVLWNLLYNVSFFALNQYLMWYFWA